MYVLVQSDFQLRSVLYPAWGTPVISQLLHWFHASDTLLTAHCLHLLHLWHLLSSNIHPILRRICVVCASLCLTVPLIAMGRPARPSRPPLRGLVELCLALTGSCLWTGRRQAPIIISQLISIQQYCGYQPATMPTLAGASSSLVALTLSIFQVLLEVSPNRLRLGGFNGD